jgi:hypothetical protein
VEFEAGSHLGKIGADAFEGTQLRLIRVPIGAEIDESAFGSNCKVETLVNFID